MITLACQMKTIYFQVIFDSEICSKQRQLLKNIKMAIKSSKMDSCKLIL